MDSRHAVIGLHCNTSAQASLSDHLRAQRNKESSSFLSDRRQRSKAAHKAADRITADEGVMRQLMEQQQFVGWHV
jgi:hypothetical protein